MGATTGTPWWVPLVSAAVGAGIVAMLGLVNEWLKGRR